MANGTNNAGTGLNEFQARHLRVACQHIDKLLGDLEEVLHSSESKSVFPRYVPELSPVQRKTIEDYTAQLRAQLLRVLKSQNVESEPSRIAEAHAVHTLLTFVEIALEELTPEDMAGYGSIAPEAATQLKGIVQELTATTSQMHLYVLQRSRQSVEERLSNLRGQSSLVTALGEVQRIISRHGFVEFRPRLLMLLDLLEDRTFEIGIFGRVSSGKSSLLNRIIGEDILPVGVTPITAVPTRIRYGQASRLLVFRDNASSAEASASDLGSFVDERFNPGNEKRVSRIVLELDAESLRGGLVFVDTPGLGSLATSGAAETLAYLPRCDYGIVLIDAAGTLAPEDLRIVEALRSASIPVSVLISKADLLSADDLDRLTAYVSQHVKSETGIRLPVHAVSVQPTHEHLLKAWMGGEIGPLHSGVADLKETSLSRKVEGLVRSLIETLKRESGVGGSQSVMRDAEKAESILRVASAGIADTRKLLRTALERQRLDEFMASLAEELAERWSAGEAGSIAAMNESLARKVTSFAAACYAEVSKLATTLQSNLEQAAAALGMKGTATEPFHVNELPVFDFSLRTQDLPKPNISFLGQRFLDYVARQRLMTLRPVIKPAWITYIGRMKSWADLAIAGVESQFDSYAQEYRTQAQRLLSGGSSSEPSTDLKAEIDALEGLFESDQLQPASGM